MAEITLVTPRDEEILKAVHYYRYVTARDIAHQGPSVVNGQRIAVRQRSEGNSSITEI